MQFGYALTLAGKPLDLTHTYVGTQTPTQKNTHTHTKMENGPYIKLVTIDGTKICIVKKH